MGVGINDTSTRIKYTADYASDTYRDDGEKLRADFKEVLPPATGPSPEDACLESERGKILRNVLSTLTPREHLVIRRRFFAARECTQKELAEEMGISRQLVELTEYQALMKLREALGDDAEELLG
jgi:RNA polymerase sigma factor (sigma-70 family)